MEEKFNFLHPVIQNGRKRKQHSSSGPANSTGTGNTVGPSPSSPASTHTPGDGMTSASSLQHVSSVSKSMMMYGGDGTGGIASSTNQLVKLTVIHAHSFILQFCTSFIFVMKYYYLSYGSRIFDE